MGFSAKKLLNLAKELLSSGKDKVEKSFETKYMRNDINLTLLVLIVIVVVFIIGLSLYYHLSYSGLLDDYEELHNTFLQTKTNLSSAINALNEFKQKTLNISDELQKTMELQTQSREEFNEIYEQTENELTVTEEELAEKKSELEQTNEELKNTVAELEDKKSKLSAAAEEIESLKRFEGKFNDLEDDVDDCRDLSDNAARLTCYDGIYI